MALAMMVGIAAQHWLAAVPTTAWTIATAAAAVAGGVLLALRRNMAHYPTLLLALLCVACIGAMLGRRNDPRHNKHDWVAVARSVKDAKTGRQAIDYEMRNPTEEDGDVVVWLAARLKETPQPRERSWRVKAAVEGIDGKYAEGPLTIYFRKDSMASALRYGDRLLIHGHADVARRSLYTTSDHYIITQRDSTSLRAHSEHLRMALLRRMQAGPLDEHAAGVAEAMTLGWRAAIGQETRTNYRDAGIAHLLAVSGLHIGLLAGMVGALCFWIPRDRRGKTLRGTVTLAAVWTYCMLTGMAPSSVRAALMFSLMIVSTIGERGTPTINLLALAAIITLTAQPMLLMDVGWQLSYSAVAGILLARPLITLYANKIWQASMVSIAATLATLPVMVGVFHQMQPYFLIANVLIVPLAGIVLAMALVYMALPSAVTAWPLERTLEAMGWLTGKVAALPGAHVELEATAWWVTAALAVAATAILVGINATMRPRKASVN